jgi:hypothetical protein
VLICVPAILLEPPALQVDHLIAVLFRADDVAIACQLDSSPVRGAVKRVYPSGERFAVRACDSLGNH